MHYGVGPVYGGGARLGTDEEIVADAVLERDGRTIGVIPKTSGLQRVQIHLRQSELDLASIRVDDLL